MPNQFFAEGNDEKFIRDIIAFAKKNKQDDIYIPANGWTNLHHLKNKFLENTNKGGKNFVLFDADDNSTQRRKDLMQKKQELGIEFELFLFPDDNANGTVETLLLQIILPVYQPIFDCFQNYLNCLSGITPQCTLPNEKSKFFAFTESTGQETNLTKIQFTDSRFYSLTHKTLDNLYNFISTHVQ